MYPDGPGITSSTHSRSPEDAPRHIPLRDAALGVVVLAAEPVLEHVELRCARQTKESKHPAASLLIPLHPHPIPTGSAHPFGNVGSDPSNCWGGKQGVGSTQYLWIPGKQSTHVLQTACAQQWSLVSAPYTHRHRAGDLGHPKPRQWESRRRMLPVSQLCPSPHVGSPEHHPSRLEASTVIPQQGHRLRAPHSSAVE